MQPQIEYIVIEFVFLVHDPWRVLPQILVKFFRMFSESIIEQRKEINKPKRWVLTFKP